MLDYPLTTTSKVAISMLSGGADASIHLWDLERRGAELSFLHKPSSSLTKYCDPCEAL